MSNTAKYADVYLDAAAGTPLDPDALSAMLPYFGAAYRNPSSMHAGGRAARRAIEDARVVIANHIGAAPEEILFTGSGTESDNLAIVGAARAYKKDGDHVIISAAEHKAVLESARALQTEQFRVTVLPVDQYGMVDPETVAAALEDATILISLIYANNELGSVNRIQDIVRAVREKRAPGRLPLIHTDACQAMQYLDVDVHELGVDLMTFNGEKLYGPSGIAALFKKRGVRLTPLIRGGEQEQLLRAGTEATPLIVGFAKALEQTRALREEEVKRLGTLRAYFVHSLHQALPDLIVNGHPTEVLPNIVHVTVPGVEGEAMLLALDERGIAVSTGSACSAFDLRPSHVLSAIGQDADLIHGSIRFSFGRDTTKEKLDYVVKEFANVVQRLQSLSAVTTHAYATLNR